LFHILHLDSANIQFSSSLNIEYIFINNISKLKDIADPSYLNGFDKQYINIELVNDSVIK